MVFMVSWCFISIIPAYLLSKICGPSARPFWPPTSTCLTCLFYVAHFQSYVVNFTVNNVHLTVDTLHFILSILCTLRCSFHISHPVQ